MVKDGKICVSEIFESIDGELIGAYHLVKYSKKDNL